MPLNKDRGLELFDNIRRAVERDARIKNHVINSSMQLYGNWPAVCFSHRDETTGAQRHTHVLVADNLVTQAMVRLVRPTVVADRAPIYLIPIGDVGDAADLVLEFLLKDTNPTEPHQMKENWKWDLGD